MGPQGAGAGVGLVAGATGRARAGGPEGQLTWGVHISLAPTWFDPAETPGIITPFMVLYALHDALVKPMPGKPMAPCLAESWTASKGGPLQVRRVQAGGGADPRGPRGLLAKAPRGEDPGVPHHPRRVDAPGRAHP